VAVLRSKAAHSNYKISDKKVRRNLHQMLVQNAKSTETIKNIHDFAFSTLNWMKQPKIRQKHLRAYVLHITKF
jgi:hypothetical protein